MHMVVGSITSTEITDKEGVIFATPFLFVIQLTCYLKTIPVNLIGYLI